MLANFRSKVKDLWGKLRISKQIQKSINNDFQKKAEAVIVLDKKDFINCKVAAEAYKDPMQRINNHDKRELLIENNRNNNSHCIYVNHERKILTIGYRGTVVTNVNDLSSDLQIILWVSNMDERVGESLDVYDEMRLKFPDYEKWICWHSLGWTICYVVAKHRNPARCCVFNPGWSINQMFLHMITDTIQKKPRTLNIYTYKILWDPISSFSFVWNTKIFIVAKKDPLWLHALTNFTNAIPEVYSESLIPQVNN